jgi:FMN phosphatase YigB (HAD superfamily)
MPQIASFDVFDTVLTRAVGSPYMVFLLLGRRLHRLSLIPCTPEAFARARIDAQRRASRNAGGADSNVTLGHIYAELESVLGFTAEQSDRLVHLEYALEEELIRPVPGVQDRIQAARARGQRVVFVSDMYLSAAFIQKQLAQHGLWIDGDGCYVSCEYAKSKVTGALFRELLRREGVASTRVTHCGNDQRGDIRAAQRIGLRVTPFLDANPNRYEQILESHAWATEGLSSVMAGASRRARLTVAAPSAKRAALRDIAASVIAPTLVGYVLWILRRAQQLGLQRLYFMSRDGQILLEIARRLVGKLHLSCELRYLYGSRRSWLLPAITSINAEQLSFLHSFSPSPTVRHLLSRVDIAPEDISDSLVSIGLPEKSWSRHLCRSECQSLYTLLQDDSRAHRLILQRAAARRALMIRYLQQEGLPDLAAWAMVDVGWLGRLQNALGRILDPGEGTPPVGFYFGLRSNPPITPSFGRQEAYFFNERRGVGFIDLLPRQGVLMLLEVFCSGDHGQVIGFEKKGEAVCPILKEDLNPQLLDGGLQLIRETIYCFIEHLLLDASLINVEADMRAATAEVLKAFWLRPAVVEARAFADFPCEIGFADDTSPVRLAECYRWQHVVQSLWPAPKQLHRLPMWPAGAHALTAPPVQYALKISTLVSRVCRRLLRPVKHTIRMCLRK